MQQSYRTCVLDQPEDAAEEPTQAQELPTPTPPLAEGRGAANAEDDDSRSGPGLAIASSLPRLLPAEPGATTMPSGAPKPPKWEPLPRPVALAGEATLPQAQVIVPLAAPAKEPSAPAWPIFLAPPHGEQTGPALGALDCDESELAAALTKLAVALVDQPLDESMQPADPDTRTTDEPQPTALADEDTTPLPVPPPAPAWRPRPLAPKPPVSVELPPRPQSQPPPAASPAPPVVAAATKGPGQAPPRTPPAAPKLHSSLGELLDKSADLDEQMTALSGEFSGLKLQLEEVRREMRSRMREVRDLTGDAVELSRKALQAGAEPPWQRSFERSLQDVDQQVRSATSLHKGMLALGLLQTALLAALLYTAFGLVGSVDALKSRVALAPSGQTTAPAASPQLSPANAASLPTEALTQAQGPEGGRARIAKRRDSPRSRRRNRRR